MFDHKFRGNWILLLLGIATVAPVYADGPRPGFKLNADPTITSPGQALRVEQYSKDLKDQGVRYSSGRQQAAPKDRKMLASRGKISMLQPKPLRWPRDVHVLIGPGPEYQEKQP
jgi:hypothetical protein